MADQRHAAAFPELAPYLDPDGLIDGRYDVVRRLGSGGMGAVYEAVQVRLLKRVALKVLRPELLSRETAVKRFLREARAASSISHRNVVDIIDYGELPGGSVYYVMEYLEGRDLSGLLKEHRRLPWSRARGIVLQLVAALDAAHGAGIVHRDIKPANVFMVRPREGDPPDPIKVLDFGIAKTENSTPETQALTGTSELMGTAYYMAPEQANAEPADARTDVYAVGVLLYELLTGEVPFFDANAFKVLFRHTTEPPRPPRQLSPEIPPAVEAIVLRALAKLREHRQQSMAELDVELRSVDPSGNLLPDAPRWLHDRGTAVLHASGSSEQLRQPTQFLGGSFPASNASFDPVTPTYAEYPRAPTQPGQVPPHLADTGKRGGSITEPEGASGARQRGSNEGMHQTASSRANSGDTRPRTVPAAVPSHTMANPGATLGGEPFARPAPNRGRAALLGIGGIVIAFGLALGVGLVIIDRDDAGPTTAVASSEPATPEPAQVPPEEKPEEKKEEAPAEPEIAGPPRPVEPAPTEAEPPTPAEAEPPTPTEAEPPKPNEADSRPSNSTASRPGKRPPKPKPAAEPATDETAIAAVKKKAAQACGGAGLSLQVSFAIDGAGKVLMPRVAAPHQDSDAARCVIGQLRGYAFPASGKLRQASFGVSL